MKDFMLISLICSVMSNDFLYSQFNAPDMYIHPDSVSFQFEPSIATHPLNSNIILVAADARSNERSRIGWYYTTDGGLTWTGRDTLPTQSDFSKLMTDPAAAIDLDGYLFVSGIHKGIFVARSTNGGQNWSQTTLATPGGPERPHMTIDRDPDSPYKNNVYVVYTDVSSAPRPVYFSRSTDQGVTFSTPVTISGTVASLSSFGANLAVGTNSVVYATWSGFDSPPFLTPQPFHLGFNVSTDGGTSWSGAKDLRRITFNGSAHGVSFFNHPSMAVDRSDSPKRGWIYIVYAERNPSAPDIFIIRSTDSGVSWSDPVKVNQDGGNTRDQWQPWISVDPATGNVFIIYLDSRNFPNNDSAEVYVSTSIDGAQTFRDIRVSDNSFLPTPAQLAPPIVPNYMGSYIGITALRDTIWTAWNDNRTELFFESKRLHQVYASRIIFSPLSGPNGTLSTSAVNFDSVNIGKSKDEIIIITNYGDDTLRISSIASSNPAFSVSPATGNIPPGKTFLDTLRFIPTTVGEATGLLVFTSNGILSSDTIDLSGIGIPLTSVEAVFSQVPVVHRLSQNFPNPFNPTTNIRFTLPVSGFMSLKIYDVLGREVAILVNEEQRAGSYEVRWNAIGFSSGVYFYRLQSGEFVQTKKLLLMK